MQRKYVSYEDVQKYIGEGNMLIFYEAMAEKMELYKKKKIKINFINYTLYMKYEERFIKNECKCQYKNDQKVENKNVHFPRSIPQLVFP